MKMYIYLFRLIIRTQATGITLSNATLKTNKKMELFLSMKSSVQEEI